MSMMQNRQEVGLQVIKLHLPKVPFATQEQGPDFREFREPYVECHVECLGCLESRRHGFTPTKPSKLEASAGRHLFFLSGVFVVLLQVLFVSCVSRRTLRV